MREYLLYSNVILWATMRYCPMNGLQLAPQAVCLTWCGWDDLLGVISLAGWVGFLRSQIWTPIFVHRLTIVDCMGWMLRLVPRVCSCIHAPVRKSYHQVCCLLPHVKPIHFLPTMEKKGVVGLLLHPVHFVLVVLSQEYSILTICLASSVSLTAPSCPAVRT